MVPFIITWQLAQASDMTDGYTLRGWRAKLGIAHAERVAASRALRITEI